MTSITTHVTSIASLKRRAKELARQHSLKHHEALDRVAQEAGLHNYIHASRVLPEKTLAAPPAKLYPLPLG